MYWQDQSKPSGMQSGMNPMNFFQSGTPSYNGASYPGFGNQINPMMGSQPFGTANNVPNSFSPMMGTDKNQKNQFNQQQQQPSSPMMQYNPGFQQPFSQFSQPSFPMGQQQQQPYQFSQFQPPMPANNNLQFQPQK